MTWPLGQPESVLGAWSCDEAWLDAVIAARGADWVLARISPYATPARRAKIDAVLAARVDSVAVAIEDGLVTPVVRDADKKGLGAINGEVADLARRARERALKAHEISGSTFTVSNLGMFDIERFTAIINPPEAAILAVGGIVEEPVVKAGAIVVGKRMTLTMSCDHRVIDGALGARFLAALVEQLEAPESLAL